MAFLGELPEALDILDFVLEFKDQLDEDAHRAVVRSLQKVAEDGSMDDSSRAEFATRVADSQVAMVWLDEALSLYRLAYRAAPGDETYADGALAFCREQDRQENLVEDLMRGKNKQNNKISISDKYFFIKMQYI